MSLWPCPLSPTALLDGDGFRTAAQLAPVGVERVIGKDKLHRQSPPTSCPTLFA